MSNSFMMIAIVASFDIPLRLIDVLIVETTYRYVESTYLGVQKLQDDWASVFNDAHSDSQVCMVSWIFLNRFCL